MTAIEYTDGNIKIDIYYLFSAMDEESQKSFIHTLALQKQIIELVVDYLCGQDAFGSWSGYDDDWRMQALTRIEGEQLKNWSRYNWKVFSELTDRLKEIRAKEHIYWALHHGAFRDELWPAWDRFCKANGIESNYTTKQADEDIARIEKMLREALNKFAEPMRAKELEK
jgi:hypothetical protein